MYIKILDIDDSEIAAMKDRDLLKSFKARCESERNEIKRKMLKEFGTDNLLVYDGANVRLIKLNDAKNHLGRAISSINNQLSTLPKPPSEYVRFTTFLKGELSTWRYNKIINKYETLHRNI